jgi:EAL domain-containing protein (putative c-di-GMP-specific phosphodiesterase class I)
MLDAAKRESAHWKDPVASLRRALAQDHFTLYCQPIAALSGVVVYPMAEVLVRLREEETALLPPGDFLPVLEYYGMLPELDRWVVREVLRRLSAGPEIPRFAMHLSAQTIADAKFPEFFAEALHASGVPADCVVFEIEERDAIAAPSSVRRLAAALGSLGAGVLIDGFGRVEEFVDLLEVPCVQYVKVHGSLTRSLAVNEVAAAKMQAILALATELEIAVIAECVEEPEVLARLKAMKVRYAQGFGICVPQPIDLILGLPAMRFSELRVEESSALAAQGTAEPGTSPQQEAAWSS